jgi:hypothetical protein
MTSLSLIRPSEYSVVSHDNHPKIRSRPIGGIEIPDTLKPDIQKLGTVQFNPDYSEFAVGKWASLALHNRDGNADSSLSHEYAGQGLWTEHAMRLPAIKNIVTTTFETELMRSCRIFVAQGGGMIRPHRDYTEFMKGFTRVHLVIETNPLAMNGEGNVAYHMDLGTIWYLDGRLPHWAANLSVEPRYHVVGDFPADLAPEECIRKEWLNGELEINWTKRKPLPAEIAKLIKFSAECAAPECMSELLDLVDSFYVLHDCGLGTPYDLVMPYLGEKSACVDRLIERRSRFLGF